MRASLGVPWYAAGLRGAVEPGAALGHAGNGDRQAAVDRNLTEERLDRGRL
jgi:hypothetical protein